jgi:hypothetical protein
MIEILEFIVEYKGDPSVGMFPNSWTINGHFVFENEVDENEFVKKIKEAFEYCSDTPIGVTSIARRIDGVFSEGFDPKKY